MSGVSYKGRGRTHTHGHTELGAGSGGGGKNVKVDRINTTEYQSEGLFFVLFFHSADWFFIS